NWNPRAVSPAAAQGIAQFIPDTGIPGLPGVPGGAPARRPRAGETPHPHPRRGLPPSQAAHGPPGLTRTALP
ncbi:hypothetical protein AB0K09_12525, partial [Streptomyces sp. NPDC049577]